MLSRLSRYRSEMTRERKAKAAVVGSSPAHAHKILPNTFRPSERQTDRQTNRATDKTDTKTNRATDKTDTKTGTGKESN